MRHSKLFCAAALAFASRFCLAQQPLLRAAPDADPPSKPAEPSAIAVAQKPSGPALQTGLSHGIDRWVNITELSFAARYRSEKSSDEVAYIKNGQQRSIAAGRLTFDAAARYTLHFKVSSGQTFNWAYSDFALDDYAKRSTAPTTFAALPLPVLEKLLTVIADGYPVPVVPSRGWAMMPRQLFIGAAPVSWLSAEYGSLGIERGKASEITTYDDDGYLTGERLRVNDPKDAWFDEIAITYAYEGDVLKPNFLDRTQHLKKSNYHQFLFSKDFSKRIGASADYTFDKKTHTLREAAYVRLPEAKVADALRVELYQRLNTVNVGPLPFSGGSGFGLTAEKTLPGRIKLDGGYEQVDPHYGALVDNVVMALGGFSMNGDSYSTGKHLFAHANVGLTPFASLSGFYIHQTAPPPTGEVGFAKEGFNGALNIDLKKLVNSKQRVL